MIVRIEVQRRLPAPHPVALRSVGRALLAGLDAAIAVVRRALLAAQSDRPAPALAQPAVDLAERRDVARVVGAEYVIVIAARVRIVERIDVSADAGLVEALLQI